MGSDCLNYGFPGVFANKGVVLCVQPFISPDKSSHIIWIIAMVWCWQNDRGLCPHVPAELVSVCWLSAGSVQQEHEWSPSATSALSSNQNAAFFGILQSECSILRHPPIRMQHTSASSNQNAAYFGILQSECSILRHPPIRMQHTSASSNQNTAYFGILQSARSVLYTHPVSMKCASPFLGSINICHHWI